MTRKTELLREECSIRTLAIGEFARRCTQVRSVAEYWVSIRTLAIGEFALIHFVR